MSTPETPGMPESAVGSENVVDRRGFLRGLAAASAVATVGDAVSPAFGQQASGAGTAKPAVRRYPIDEPVGMLYDATKCIGCKTCVVACHEANDLPPDTRRDPRYDAPLDLNDYTKNIIKLYRAEDGETTSFIKAQCMHCVDPACAAACMIGALQKREHGIVTWDPNRCIGCRYCQVACPYNVPKFEWDSATPKIVKCELCNHLLADGGQPACCRVCPTHAVIFGSGEELLAEAKRRIAEHPDRYEPKVYGEHDGGGTQVLYLSKKGIPFEKLGLPALSEEPVPERARTIQHSIYQGAIAPTVLYGLVLAGVWRSRRSGAKDSALEQEDSE